MEYKVKIITGFREDQYYSISAEEAHKAYYLFLNPEKRGVFSNGVALIGKNIQGIEPDWNGTLGYNPTYALEAEDWNDLRRDGTDKTLRNLLQQAKQVADMVEDKPELMGVRLSEAVLALPQRAEISAEVNALAESMRV